MSYDVGIDRESLDEARLGIVRRPERVKAWRYRLAADQIMTTAEAGDMVYDVTPWPGSHWNERLIEALTGEKPLTMMRNPGRTGSCLGFTCYPTATVAWALILLRRLGVPVGDVIIPLARRLADKRANPLLTHTELNVMWSPKEDRTPHAFRWPAVSGMAGLRVPVSAHRLRQGQLVLSGYSPDGNPLQVVAAKAGVTAQRLALDVGLRLTLADLKGLARRCQAAGSTATQRMDCP